MTITRPTPSDEAISSRVLSYLDQGLALPGDLYTDPGIYAEELRLIFGRQWLYAGHVSQLPDPGDYLVVEVGAESGIVTRDRDGEIHGLLNVCRHRGARLLEQPCGTTRRLVCPYHQWAYDLDGSLAGAPRMAPGFDRSAYPLKKLHTAVWNGFVFINFAQGEVEDVTELLASSDPIVAPFDIASARVAHTEVYDVAANWKLVWENSQECYHCNANHPEFIRTFDNSTFHTGDVAPIRAFSEDRRMQSAVFPLKASATSLTMTGEPASTRRLGEFGEAREPYTASAHLKPSFATVFSPDYGITFADIPTAVDRTQVRVQWLVHADAQEGRDYDLANLKRVWDETNKQDWELCRSVQGGVRSESFEPGPLSLDETSVAAFYYSYARMLSAAGS